MGNSIRIDEAERHCETGRPFSACPFLTAGCSGCKATASAAAQLVQLRRKALP
jgi:hypothetical protein